MSKDFKRQEYARYKKLGIKWRRPRGKTSKMRRYEAGKPDMPAIGYRTPRAIRDLHPSGYNDVLVDYRMRDDSMTASKTKMIKPQWNIYRKVLKMNVFASAYYLFCWGINGLLKYKTGKK